MTIVATTLDRRTAVLVFKAMRPRQWIKNLLVVAAPLAAGRILESDIAVGTGIAFGSFILASSSVYLLNDVVDVDGDRQHPVKRHRPIASGQLAPQTAVKIALGLACSSLWLASLAGQALVALLGGYILFQVAYAFRLKHEPVVDIAVVASGFLLRTVSGGLAAGLEISAWFLLVAGFGSLFIVGGKRYSELRQHGSSAGTRRSLSVYTDSYLRFVWSASAALTILTYSLWAMEQSDGLGVPWHALSIAPLVLGILRYAVAVDAAQAEDPEQIAWSDHSLQMLGVIWLLLVASGVWHG